MKLIQKRDKDDVVSIDREQSATIKGILICLVVLGHNRFFTDVLPSPCWAWLYSFHVACFFILPFFYPGHTFSLNRIWTNTRRLLWPYTYMFVFLFFMYSFMMKEAFIDVGLFNTYITGNFYRLKHYIGFQYLWFMPSMFSMLAIKDIYESSSNLTKRILLFIGLVMFFIFWVFLYQRPYSSSINTTLAKLSIVSFMIGFAVFFLGMVSFIIISHWRLSVGLSSSLLICSLFGYIVSKGSIFNLIDWFSRSLLPIFCFVLLISISKGKFRILKQLGMFSLPVYIFHQPINFFLATILEGTSIPRPILLVVSFFTVLSLSYLLSKALASINKVNNGLFPR